MSDLMSLNSPVYVISDLTTTSQQITIEPQYLNESSSIIIDNSLGNTPAAVVSGATAQTAVYPTSSSSAFSGAVVAAGSVQTFTFNPKHVYIAAIRETGTADLVIKLGDGE